MNPTMYIHECMSVDHDSGFADLARLDLNLLVAFEALAAELSVTRAAARLGVTQSAMSHTLRRLRSALGDELLVRTKGGMALTPRGESLVLPIRAGLSSLQRALANPEDFDPASSSRSFRLTGPDLFELLFMPGLVARVGEVAGGISLAMASVAPGELAAQLETGELDLAITTRMLDGSQPRAQPGLMRRALLRDEWRCFLRCGHPALNKRGKLSRARFLAAPQVLVSTSGRGRGIVDVVLDELGLSRKIALRVSSFYSAPVAVAGSDLILTAPASLERAVGHLGLVCARPPIELPAHSVDMSWHQRFGDEGGHRWLREQLIAVTQGAGTRAGRSRGRVELGRIE